MLKSTTTFSLIAISIFIVSCQSAVTQKWEETMKVHDEVMLKMEETAEMNQKLNGLLEYGKNADSTNVLFQKQDTLIQAIEILEEADIEMMDWMANIQKPRKGDDQDSIIQYLEDEKIAILVVGDHMNAAIENAQRVISSFEK